MDFHTIWQQFIEGMKQTTWLEFIAVITGIVSVWFSRIENTWTFPIGLINTTVYVWISVKGNLFGEASVNFYYTVLNVYGWILWTKKGAHKHYVVNIEYSNTIQWIQQIAFFAVFLYRYIFYSYLFKKIICTGRNTMG